jgi:3'-5' exoribonuclease 1
MNFIVFDLEATCWEDRLGRPSEIIEIGAIKLNDYAEAKGTFDAFVKPIIHPFLSPFCIKLTSISQVEVNKAERFPQVVEEFQDWIEIFDEPYLLCSWGNFDKTQLIKDCELHGLETDWLEAHINLKEQYRQIRGMNKGCGLKRAVLQEGFEFEGTHHRGIDDAFNLAKVFGKLFDQWQY